MAEHRLDKRGRYKGSRIESASKARVGKVSGWNSYLVTGGAFQNQYNEDIVEKAPNA